MNNPHLEGLIAEVNSVATLADEARGAYVGHHASGTFRRIAERLDAVRAVRAALAALPGGGVDELRHVDHPDCNHCYSLAADKGNA